MKVWTLLSVLLVVLQVSQPYISTNFTLNLKKENGSPPLKTAFPYLKTDVKIVNLFGELSHI